MCGKNQLTAIFLVIFFFGTGIISGCAFLENIKSFIIPNQDAEEEPLPEPEKKETGPLVVPPDGWIFEKKAMTLRVQPSNDLNIFQDRAHNILLAIFQISDPNIFNEKSSTQAGISELLTMENINAGLGIVNLKKVVIRPGKISDFMMDRSKSAQYVGFVAGYAHLIPENVAKIFEIPAIQDNKTGVDRINPLADPVPPRPGRLKILLELDNSQIENIKIYAN